MKCLVEDCDREARYKEKCLCQKHYFRLWRNGTTDLVRKARDRYEDDKGYQFIYAPKHPLVNKGQIYVPEHRAVLYGVIGNNPMSCAICRKSLTWKTCCVDHIDNNKRNNDPKNLRPTCMNCNAERGWTAPSQWSWTTKITYEGVTLTATEWCRDPRVNLSHNALLRRIKSGMSAEDALFAPKKTHKFKEKTNERQ